MSGAVRYCAIAGSQAAYREWTGPAEAGPRTILCLHGYPTSSYLWRHVAPHLAPVGRVLALDLAGFGDSDLGERAGTWEEQVAFVEAFVRALALPAVDLVVHDWGGLIGLWWLTEHPAAARSLVITDTGFFSDGRWHAVAKTYRTPGEGEALVEAITREGLGNMMRGACPGLPDDAVAEYWKSHATPARGAAKLALYRSGDFEKLEGREWRLGEVAPPTCIIWGAKDPFAPVGGGHRLHKRIAGSEMHVLDDAGHFLQEDAPDVVGRLAADFLRRH